LPLAFPTRSRSAVLLARAAATAASARPNRSAFRDAWDFWGWVERFADAIVVVVVEVWDALDFCGWVERFTDGFGALFVGWTTLLDFRREAIDDLRFEGGASLPTLVAVVEVRDAWDSWGWVESFADGSDSGRGSTIMEVRAAWECFMECWGSLLDFWRTVSATFVAVALANASALLCALTALSFASSRKRASAMGQAAISIGWPGMWKCVRTALRMCLGWSSESWGYAPMEMIQPFLAFMRCCGGRSMGRRGCMWCCVLWRHN